MSKRAMLRRIKQGYKRNNRSFNMKPIGSDDFEKRKIGKCRFHVCKGTVTRIDRR